MAKKKETAISNPEELKELALLPADEKKYLKLVIKSPEDALKVDEALGKIGEIEKAINAKGKPMVEVAKKNYDNVKGLLKEALEPVLHVKDYLRGIILEYQIEQKRIAQKVAEKEQAKEIKKAEKQSAKLGVEVMPAVVTVEKVKAGESQLIDNWVFVIDAPVLIPLKYQSPVQSLLNAEAKIHKDKTNIPGGHAENQPYLRRG